MPSCRPMPSSRPQSEARIRTPYLPANIALLCYTSCN
jgi:hypothetical protein